MVKTIFFIAAIPAILFTGMVYGQLSLVRGSIAKQNACTVRITNKAGSSNLVLGSTYNNPFGEPITISQFKYYITNISLIAANGAEEKIPDTWFLVNQKMDSSLVLSLSVAGRQFTAIKFLIGVDSIHNVSGVQTGALDPANAMFWTWNTGYVMAKLEGTSPLSKEPGTGVSYHIGGFRTGENTIREIVLRFPMPLVLSDTAASEIEIDADAMKWFDGVHPFKIAEIPYCTTPGKLAVSIADNYATMFSVAQIINR
jgi:hypothetical protein